jgi:hypothetical protein
MIRRVTRGPRGAIPTHRMQQQTSSRAWWSFMMTAALVALWVSGEGYGQALQKPSQAQAAMAKKRPNLMRQAQVSTPQPRAFDIAPQPLDRALTAFSTQARIQVLVAGELTSSLSSPGASGTYTPEDALRRLLGGRG